ncbi:MAG: hypothetical protein GX898_08220 [Corynebacterium sp.]|nr:hypothetical protein [Corynebacterium sp.]
MGEIEKRAGAEPPELWKFLPMAVLLSTARITMEFEVWASIPLFILAVASILIPFPPNHGKDMDGWKIHTTKGDERRAMISLAVPATVLAIDIFTGDQALFGLPPLWSSSLYGVAFGSAFTYSLARQTMLPHRRKKELIKQIIDNASLDSVTASDLDALDQPDPQLLVRGLVAHGAIDGTRVRARRLAKVLDWDVAQVHAVSRALEQRGITSKSAIMAGGDPGKFFFELTEKGVVLMKELHSGR